MEFIKMIGRRLHKLIAGMISMKFLIWTIATSMMFYGVEFSGLLWFFLSLFLVSTRVFEKAISIGWWKGR